MIKLIYDTKEDVPVEFESLYTEKDGKWHLTQVEGIKTGADVSNVQEALRKEKADHKKTKDSLRAWDGLGDPNEVKDKLEQIPALEAAAASGDKKFNKEEFDKTVENAVKAKLSPVQRQLEEANKKLATTEEENAKLTGVIRTDRIGGALRKAALEAKVIDTAVEDIVVLGSGEFILEEETGKVVHKDGVLKPEEWLAAQKDTRPHYWPTSQGAGARGGRNEALNGPNPWKHDAWNMTEQNRIEKEKGPEYADRLAQAAGLPDRNAPAPKAPAKAAA